jgi:integrase
MITTNKPKSAKPRKNQWPHIYEGTNRSGSISFYVDLRSVGGGRPAFATLGEAKTRAEQARVQRDNEGAAAFALPDHVRVDANRAHHILSPHGVTIFEVAKYYQKHVLAYKDAPLIKVIVEKYIEESERNQNRPDTIREKKSRLGAFKEDFGEQRLSDLTLENLEEWVFDDCWSPITQNNFITKISQLYNFAVRKKWADHNLASQLEHRDVDATEPVIYSVDEAEKLLKHANEYGLLPYIAIGLFAGVRTAEQLRMDGTMINFDTKTIIIPASIAKKRSRRTIDMQPALLAWLEPVKEALQAGGNFISRAQLVNHKDDFLKAAGVEWKLNALRHSFGTYHFAMFDNEGLTSRQMGNSPDVLHQHYKGLVTKAQAENFWNLRPITKKAKIIQFPKQPKRVLRSAAVG